ncbi:MAG: hypothetical protein HYZ42_09560, partial [Bacteroidetes bacterium]|nr:hypothetical protein [Bacteroidota bacterium]
MENIAIYRRIIGVYEGNELMEKDGKFFINGNETNSYTFNYKPIQSGNYRMVLYFTDVSNCVDSIELDTAFFMPSTFETFGTHILYVTDEDDKNTRITWQRCLPYHFREYQLYRSNISTSRTLIYSTKNINDTSFLDVNVDIFNIIYTYELVAIEDCNKPISYMTHQNINLQTKLNLPNVIDLKWNPYTPWNGNILYEVYRRTQFSNFIKIAETKNIIYSDKKTCDSSYIYYVVGNDLLEKYQSVSNTSEKKTLFFPITDKSNVRSISVINNDKIEIVFDTTQFKFRTSSYLVNRSVYPFFNWNLATISITDRSTISPINFKNIIRYGIIRKDFCGYHSDTGLYGQNIYLEAINVSDLTSLRWNKYKLTSKGVQSYYVYVFDNEFKYFK